MQSVGLTMLKKLSKLLELCKSCFFYLIRICQNLLLFEPGVTEIVWKGERGKIKVSVFFMSLSFFVHHFLSDPYVETKTEHLA